MRTITAEQKQKLEDLSAEGLLKGLPVQTAEKDIHVTELLKALSELEVHHAHFNDLKRGEATRHDTGIELVFAGGTCLSKAHGLISRMSEDVDIKVVLHPVALKKSVGNRARLVALHKELAALLTRLSLPLLEGLKGGNPVIRDTHRYYMVGAGYKSDYVQLPSLRPELKLELIERTPLLPLERIQFGYLYESLAGIAPINIVSIQCISVAETAAEKVLSLLRRCAFKWDGFQHDELDPALVRHVYDVAHIASQGAATIDLAKTVFPQLVERDREEFAGQNPQFDEDPLAVLRKTLIAAKENGELKQRYEERLLPLVFEPSPPTFEQAFSTFEEVANKLLG